MSLPARILGLACPLILLAACGDGASAPPTGSPDPSAPPAPEQPTSPGAGPASFVGLWAADPAWCANTAGAERPIAISLTRFEGYENGCDIDSVDETLGGYDVGLTCEAEGQTTSERARMVVSGDRLQLTWLDRSATAVSLTRCPRSAPVEPVS